MFAPPIRAGRGAVAQLGERLVCNQEVVGSIPIGSTSPTLTDAWQVSSFHADARASRPDCPPLIAPLPGLPFQR